MLRIRLFNSLLRVVAVAATMLVACEKSKEIQLPQGENAMHYNSSTAGVAASFCQADEDTVVLFFSPSDVDFDRLDTATYYIKVTLDATMLDGVALDVSKGEALVELFDMESGSRRLALSGTVKADVDSREGELLQCEVSLAVSFAEERSSAAVRFEGSALWCGEVEYRNQWTYVHNKVGPLESKIWSIFIDTSKINMWHIYLSPVTSISFEEIEAFSPVKISIPVDFPLDGTKVRICKESDITVEYMSERWDYTNASSGGVRVYYDVASQLFTIRFTTNGKLWGYYQGPITVIE